MKLVMIFAILFLMITSAFAQQHQVDSDFSSEWEATGFNNGRKIVRDSKGFFHAVYHSQMNIAAPPGGACEIMYSHTILPAAPTQSSDWAPAIPITLGLDCDNRYPSIAIEHGSSGNPTDNDKLHIVWQAKDRAGIYQILYMSNMNNTMPAPATWSPPSPVHMSYSHSLVPDIDCSLKNILHVVWQEVDLSTKSEILYTNSIDGGISWTTFQCLSVKDEFHSQTPDIATVIDFPEAPSNYTYYSHRIHVVWSTDSPSGPHICYKSSPDAGISWDRYENVSILAGSTGNDGYPSLTVSRGDIPHTVWMHGVLSHIPNQSGPYTPGLDPMNPNSFPGHVVGMYSTIPQVIHYSGRIGGWSLVETIYSEEDNEFPSIAVDRNDKLYTAWQACSSPAAQYDIWHSERLVNGGVWTNLSYVSNPRHDDLFPSEATKKAAMYTPDSDFIWTLIDSDLSSGGTGSVAAFSPAHEIWFNGQSRWNPGVDINDQHARITTPLFHISVNPVSSSTWIGTGVESGTIKIMDIHGRTVYSAVISSDSRGILWTPDKKLPHGVYRIVFQNKYGVHSKAVTFIRE